MNVAKNIGINKRIDTMYAYFRIYKKFKQQKFLKNIVKRNTKFKKTSRYKRNIIQTNCTKEIPDLKKQVVKEKHLQTNCKNSRFKKTSR